MADDLAGLACLVCLSFDLAMVRVDCGIFANAQQSQAESFSGPDLEGTWHEGQWSRGRKRHRPPAVAYDGRQWCVLARSVSSRKLRSLPTSTYMLCEALPFSPDPPVLAAAVGVLVPTCATLKASLDARAVTAILTLLRLPRPAPYASHRHLRASQTPRKEASHGATHIGCDSTHLPAGAHSVL